MCSCLFWIMFWKMYECYAIRGIYSECGDNVLRNSNCSSKSVTACTIVLYGLYGGIDILCVIIHVVVWYVYVCVLCSIHQGLNAINGYLRIHIRNWK